MECRIEITTKKGERYVEAGSYPKGHAKNPLTDAEVEQKFRALCRGMLPDDRCESILQAVWALDAMRDIGELIERVRIDDK